MTKKKIKKIIKTGTSLEITSAIFNRWKLYVRPMPQLPYKDH